MDDAFSVEENEEECFSPNWASKRDSQPQANLNTELNAFSTSYKTGDVVSETFRDVWCEESCAEQPSKSRVKSAPCLAKRNESRFRKKVLSAGTECHESCFGIDLVYYVVLY